MVKVPRYLVRGDTVGLLCPAGYMSVERAQVCIDALREWGYAVKLGTTLGNDTGNYFSATDKQRCEDLQDMLDDDSLKAIICARGGYGLTRIIDKLSFKRFKKNPKWIIGFSDVTVLHAHVYSNFNIASLHAPMAAAFNLDHQHNPFIKSLRKAIEGKKAVYKIPSHTFNNRGEAIGELIGGNLTLLAHLIGTNSDLDTTGKILFLEDVGEYLYNIDRMMYQLKRSGKFEKLAGMVIGGFSDNKDTERPFGKTAYEIIRDHTKPYQFPVAFNFPVSHEKENYALKHGVGYKLKVGKSKVILEE